MSGGCLEVGTSGAGQVVVNHPDLQPDENGVGHIVFSPQEARQLATLLNAKAAEAERESAEARRRAAAEAPVDRSSVTLTDGSPVTPLHREIDPVTGMQLGYVVLSEAERGKGFVRPYRDSYVHTPCGRVTAIARSIAETYARDPSFYGGTFCVGCRGHFPLAQFKWDDGTTVGS